jgi:hypothetical protein
LQTAHFAIFGRRAAKFIVIHATFREIKWGATAHRRRKVVNLFEKAK